MHLLIDGIADAIIEGTKDSNKPVLVVNMGGPSFTEPNKKLRENEIPVYVFPESAVKVTDYLASFEELQHKKFDTPVDDIDDVDKEAVEKIFEKVKADGRDTSIPARQKTGSCRDSHSAGRRTDHA